MTLDWKDVTAKAERRCFIHSLYLSIYLSIYIYIYRCAVELCSGPSFGAYVLKLVQVFFSLFPLFSLCFGVCLKTQIVSICAKIVFSQNCQDVKKEVFQWKIACFVLPFLYCCKRNRKRKNMEKGQKTYKNTVFKVGIQIAEIA